MAFSVPATTSQMCSDLFVQTVKNTFIDVQLVEEPECPEACLSSVRRRWNHRRIQSSPATAATAVISCQNHCSKAEVLSLAPLIEVSPRREAGWHREADKNSDDVEQAGPDEEDQQAGCKKASWSDQSTSESEHEPEHEPMPMMVQAPAFENRSEGHVFTSKRECQQSERRSRRHRGGKATERQEKGKKVFCHIHLDSRMLYPADFCLIPKLIGKSGCNTRAIWEATGIKVRLRGRGSGHIEPHTKREADCNLMMALAGGRDNAQDLGRAVQMAQKQLKEVAARYVTHCKNRGLSVPTDATLYWIGESSEASLLPSQR